MITDRPVSTVMYAEDLVRRVRANDPLAFEELYERYSPRVFGYLFQRLNGNAIDRVVPIGQALQFHRFWDGYDLLQEFCRCVYLESLPSEAHYLGHGADGRP